MEELLEKILEFKAMMESDFQIEKERAERIGDFKSVAKATLLCNMIGEFSDIAEEAEMFLELLDNRDEE